ncbi:MAG: hypothetical protein A2W22_04120 [Candidatus Levybacteria bacterium RBG_16_35_11]|nr:MAG: hypothetical protein A2W22_04120 [Candidatus Levybacteria bacterium RBG_16_35_11]
MRKKLAFLFKKANKEILIIFFLSLAFFYKLFLSPDQIIYPAYDLIEEYYGQKAYFISAFFNSHTFQLWNPLKFSGVSYIGDPQSAMFSPINVFYFIFPVYFSFGFNFFINTFLTGFFTYLFARLIKISRFSSLISSILVMFGGPFIITILPAHVYISNSITFFPLLLYLTERSIQTKRLFFALLAGIPLAFMLAAGNIQIALYGFLSTLIFFILRLLLSKDIRKNFRMYLAPLLTIITGILFLAVELVPALEFSLFSKRLGGVNYQFASDFSLPLKQTLSFIFPQFFGTPLNNSYWGRGDFWGFCGYLGVIPLILIIYMLFKKRGLYFSIFLVLSVFSILFALGSFAPVFPFFFKYVPFFNSFRVPARFLFVYGFSVAIMSGLGLDALLKDRTNRNINQLVFFFLGGIFLIFSIVVNYLPNKVDLFSKIVLRDTYAVNISKVLVFNNFILDFFVFSLIILGFGVFVYLKSEKKYLFASKLFLIFIITLNLWFYWIDYYQTKNPNLIYKKVPVIEEIKKDNANYRVFDQSGLLSKYLTIAELESITGLGPEITSSYRQFLWAVGDHSESEFDGYIDISNVKNIMPLRLLNVKYVISEKDLKDNGLEIKIDGQIKLYKIKDFLPRAYLVGSAIKVKNEDESLKIIENPNFNPKKSTTIQGYGGNYKSDQLYVEIRVLKKNPDKIQLRPFNSNEGFLVLSEPYYSGWKAFDNDREVKIFKGDGILRVIPVSSGHHKIEFVYEPFSFRIGGYISLITLFILILLSYLKKRGKFNF